MIILVEWVSLSRGVLQQDLWRQLLSYTFIIHFIPNRFSPKWKKYNLSLIMSLYMTMNCKKYIIKKKNTLWILNLGEVQRLQRSSSHHYRTFQKHQDLGLTGGFGSTSTTQAAVQGQVKKEERKKKMIFNVQFAFTMWPHTFELAI